jgi:hypothetical protein
MVLPHLGASIWIFTDMVPDEIICPHCSVDIGRDELRRNGLLCPTCGFDLSEAEDPDDQDLDDGWDEDDAAGAEAGEEGEDDANAWDDSDSDRAEEDEAVEDEERV